MNLKDKIKSKFDFKKTDNTPESNDSVDKQKSLKAFVKNPKTLAAGGVCAAILVTVAGVNAANAYATQTHRMCLTATDYATLVQKSAEKSLDVSKGVLESVNSTTLPNDGGESTLYVERAAIDAVPEQPAEGDKPASPAVPARPAGSKFIKDVEDARKDAEGISLRTSVSECESRDGASAIRTEAANAGERVARLHEKTADLQRDFAVFQRDEVARIAAEREAARLEAERIAAEEEAARQAAASYSQRGGYGYDYGYGGSSSGGDYSGGSSSYNYRSTDSGYHANDSGGVSNGWISIARPDDVLISPEAFRERQANGFQPWL